MSTTNNRTLRTVPPPPTDPATPRTETEEKLWQALQTNPGSAAAALSAAARIGKSTAPKILARWEKNGLVARTAGTFAKGTRTADRWSITTANQPTGNPATDTPATGSQPTAAMEPAEESVQHRQEKPQRLAPGGLRGMVEDFLQDNSGEFSPAAIGKALKRSSGAVHNALEKLVESGNAVRTSDKPKKYSLAATTATSAGQPRDN